MNMRTPEQLVTDTKPFKADLIEQIPGSGNRPAIDYVAWHHYTQKLLATHGGHNWFVEWQPKFEGGLWVVVGRLLLDGPGGESYDGVGTDEKSPLAAESNAYKRACAHAGIGLHLYGSYWLYDYLEQNSDRAEMAKEAANDSGALQPGPRTDTPRQEPEVRVGEDRQSLDYRPFTENE